MKRNNELISVVRVRIKRYEYYFEVTKKRKQKMNNKNYSATVLLYCAY